MSLDDSMFSAEAPASEYEADEPEADEEPPVFEQMEEPEE